MKKFKYVRVPMKDGGTRKMLLAYSFYEESYSLRLSLFSCDKENKYHFLFDITAETKDSKAIYFRKYPTQYVGTKVLVSHGIDYKKFFEINYLGIFLDQYGFAEDGTAYPLMCFNPCTLKQLPNLKEVNKGE